MRACAAVVAAIVMAATAGGCGSSPHVTASGGTIRLSSPAFAPGAAIPARYTCDGADSSPPLQWSVTPHGTAEFALTVEDLDAPGGSFTHWAIVGIGPGVRTLPAGAHPPSTVEGRNDFGRTGYGGPCPPRGSSAHRYRFVVYALRGPLSVASGFRLSAVGTELAKHTLAVGEMIGTYKR
jgi:Raf kinase inhibitor-like YbhB/YbcL family protein